MTWRRVTARVPASTLEMSAPSGLTPVDGATVEVRVADPTAAQLGLYWLARLPVGLAGLAVVGYVALLLRRARRPTRSPRPWSADCAGSPR